MNTLAFTLGVLSVIIAAFVVILIWGVVKVVKQQRQIESNQKWFDDSISNIWRNKEEDRRINYEREQHYSREFDTRFKELERTIESRLEDLHRRIDETYRQMYQTMDDQKTELSTQSKSYTDSRIDKLIDAYFEYGELNKKKQIIKG